MTNPTLQIYDDKYCTKYILLIWMKFWSIFLSLWLTIICRTIVSTPELKPVWDGGTQGSTLYKQGGENCFTAFAYH